MIQQLAEFIARAAGFNRAGDHDKALAAAARGWDELLDAPREVIATASAATLASLLRDPARIRAAAQLSYEEGRALDGRGDPERAQLAYRRALELVREAQARQPSDSDDGALQELSHLVSDESRESSARR